MNDELHESVSDKRDTAPEIGASFANTILRHSDTWCADLSLRFSAHQTRTVLVEKKHTGPLVVQKALYPEGDRICHAIVVHPPGGIAGGDRLQLRVKVDADAHALITTPGAGKWYKSNGRISQQQLHFTVAHDAMLEWLPQETIVFDAANARMQTQVNLHGEAKYAGWEIVCFGRRAAGEAFASGSVRQHTQIFRDGELIWYEAANFDAGARVMRSPVGMSDGSLSATFVIAAGSIPQPIIDACREIIPRAGNQYGVTALPEIFVARCIGDNGECVRDYFEAIWKIVRPWYANTEMQRPRIWST